MNRATIIIFLLIITSVTKINAQFAPVGSTWNFIYYGRPNLPGPGTSNEKLIAIADTLLDGKIYSKIVDEYLSIVYLTINSSKVYYYKKNQHNLLFDFNSKKGDTLELDYYNGGWGDQGIIRKRQIKIDSIYSISDKMGTAIKCFTYSIFDSLSSRFVWGNTICEKFNYDDSNYGLFTLNLGEPFDGGSFAFTCYFEPNGYKFILVDSAECNTVSVDEVKSKENTFTIYPNPAQNRLLVEGSLPIQSLELYSLEGKLLISDQHSNSLDITGISNGLYVVKITSNNNMVDFKRVVVQH